MNLRFHNAKILSDPDHAPFCGELHVRDGLISCVRQIKQGEQIICNESFDREIDCENNLLMSGFCNAHAHSAMCLFRGIADDLSLEDWLFERIFPLEKYLTSEDVYWGTMLQIAEYVRSGITCFADMYYFEESVYNAAMSAGLCLALCSPYSSQNGSDILSKIAKNYYLYSTLSDRVRYFPGLHAEYTCDEKLLEQVADFAAETGARTNIHLSETLKEVGDCTVRHGGLTPPQYLHKLGFFDNGGLAAHCVYVDKDDIALLNQCGVVPVINGGSNLKLASGIAPVASMLSAGMQPAIGTDGTASNNAASVFREMYLYSCLQKQALKDARTAGAEKALAAATVNGYDALGFRGGRLKKGFFADMILVDLHAPNMNPQSDIKTNLVYSADNSNVLMTVAGGKIVYERGLFHIGESIDLIYSECERRIKRLLRRAAYGKERS